MHRFQLEPPFDIHRHRRKITLQTHLPQPPVPRTRQPVIPFQFGDFSLHRLPQFHVLFERFRPAIYLRVTQFLMRRPNPHHPPLLFRVRALIQQVTPAARRQRKVEHPYILAVIVKTLRDGHSRRTR